MKRLMFWGLFGITLAIYGTMLAWSLPTVSVAAGGLTPFDMRPSGYSFAEAQAFLASLSAEGAEFYTNVQQKLDLVYPPLMSLSLFFAVAFLASTRLGGWRWVLASAALPTAVFDALENHAVAAMIAAGAVAVTPAMVADSSQWTVLKSSSTLVVMSLLLVLLAIKGIQYAREVLQRRATG